jgi:CRISPR-associated protein Csd1
LPSVQRLLVKTTAVQERFDNIPEQLAGEVMRAILSGTRYPRTLLSAAIMRLRAGDDAGKGWHAAAIRAVLARDQRLRFKTEDWLVSLDKQFPDPAYHLGRLFAAVDTAQRLALGRVNASIRDRYFGAASATPAAVFPVLLKGAQNHLGKLRKDGKGGWLEREIEEITDLLAPELPRSLSMENQGEIRYRLLSPAPGTIHGAARSGRRRYHR